MGVSWPVFTSSAAVGPWSAGDHVEIRLRWRDDPALPAELSLHDVPMRASTLRAADGVAWAQLVTSGALSAARTGHEQPGDLRLNGCLTYESYEQWEQVPVTAGTIRRIRVLELLHDRGDDFWVPRPDAYRLVDEVPGGDPEPAGDDTQVPEGVVLLSPEEYFVRARHLLPETEWQPQGLLIDLEVPSVG
jgi:hypothetical protein